MTDDLRLGRMEAKKEAPPKRGQPRQPHCPQQDASKDGRKAMYRKVEQVVAPRTKGRPGGS